MAYTVTAWKNGDLITADLLNHAEEGISAASSAVDELKKATATATALAAGEAPTVTFDGSSFAFGIPAGAQGAQGAKGDTGAAGAAGADGADGTNGTNGKDGAAGKQGASFRVSAVALTDDQADIAADALAPSNAVLPYAVGDTVLDATTKKLYAITAVKSCVATIGTAIATLP